MGAFRQAGLSLKNTMSFHRLRGHTPTMAKIIQKMVMF
jgi:hypothetical protein